MSVTPSSSSSESGTPAAQSNPAMVGLGVAAYSSSDTPFNSRPSPPACANRHCYAPDLFDSSSSSSPPSSSSNYHHSCSNFQLNSNSNVTLTLITATPLTTLATPLIPIVQQLNSLNNASSISSPAALITQSCYVNQLPCSSSVGSSSTQPARDWFTYEYRLDNIESLIKSHESQQGFVQSPSFAFAHCEQAKQASNWRLIFYPNGAGSDCKNFLSIFLKYLSDEPVKVQMMFSIVDNNNDDVYVKYTVNKFQKSNDWGFKQLIHKNAILYQKDKFFKANNGLLVRVKMRLDEHKNDYLKKLNENLHYCRLLSENFSQFYQNSPSELASTSSSASSSLCSSSVQLHHYNHQQQHLSQQQHQTSSLSLSSSPPPDYEPNYFDILLLVRSQESEGADEAPMAKRARLDQFVEFKAHKCVLAARSPVFRAMFNYKLKESLTSQVVIEDCRPEVVRAMLKYIYTAYLPDEARLIAFDLYIAAEKYFIESLKIKCREYLVENLTMDNCIQMYILAEIYNDSMLRKQSLKFINENIDKVTQNCEWNEFIANYPQFFTNAFIRICKKDF